MLAASAGVMGWSLSGSLMLFAYLTFEPRAEQADWKEDAHSAFCIVGTYSMSFRPLESEFQFQPHVTSELSNWLAEATSV